MMDITTKNKLRDNEDDNTNLNTNINYDFNTNMDITFEDPNPEEMVTRFVPNSNSLTSSSTKYNPIVVHMSQEMSVNTKKYKKTKITPILKIDGICPSLLCRYDSSKHLKITCPRCPYEACRSCYQRYLLNKISAPHCMECKTRWTQQDLICHLGRSFVTTTYRLQRGRFLLDRAKSFIPLAMPYFEVEKTLVDSKAELIRIEAHLETINKNFLMAHTPQQLEYDQTTQNRRQIIHTIHNLYRQSYYYHNRRNNHQQYQSYEEPCPVQDCRGLIDKTKSRCAVCEMFVCRRCLCSIGKLSTSSLIHLTKNNVNSSSSSSSSSSTSSTSTNENSELSDMLKEIADFEQKTMAENPEISQDDDAVNDTNLTDEEKKELRDMKKTHTCKPEDIESVKEIRKNCRCCPECKAKIFRMDGCDTMWCIKCETGFNWSTGVIIENVKELHNPHFAEFVRNNPDFQYNRTRHGNNDEEKKDFNNQQQQQQPHLPNIRFQANPCDAVTLDNIVIPNINDIFIVTNHLLYDLSRPSFAQFQQNMLHMKEYAHKKFVRGHIHDDIDYALRYLVGTWDEKRWRIQIEHNDRFRQTNQEYVDVIITWLVVMRDLFDLLFNPSTDNNNTVTNEKKEEEEEEENNDTPVFLSGSFYDDPKQKKISLKEADNLLNQMNKISVYTNETLKNMNDMYKRKTEYVLTFTD